MKAFFKRIWSHLVMTKLSRMSFMDCVTGEQVYYFKDRKGHIWMAHNSRTFWNFRVRCEHLDEEYKTKP